ncbi:MAG TPA: BTAD domain-containing putative transcriptional regulator [Gemmatimonadales bacterium]
MIRLHLLGALELAASDGRDLHPLVAQPKRLAVLAYLAARPASEFVRRDTLLGVFWPELDQGAARRSLRQTLHVIRTHLGNDALNTRGDDEVAVNPGAVACDVPEFLALVAEGRLDDASEAYRGDLLAGFFLGGGSAPFEQWLETERERLRGLAAKGVWSLADAAERAGDRSGAAGWARRAAALTADDELVLRRLIQLLLRVGDRAGGLHAYDAFARRLARDFGEEPAVQTRALIAGLGGIVTPAPAPLGDVPTPRPRPRWLAPAAAGVALLVLVAAARTLLGRHAEPPVLAVGEVMSGDSTAPGLAVRTLPELLATDLAQVGGLRVISQPRLEEVAAQLRPAGQPAIAAARAAGADELLEGELYRRGADSLRLDLRQVDARTGMVRHALTLRGADVFALADSAAAWFAGRYGLAPPKVALARATSASLVAHGLYDEGLRAYYRAVDYRAAERLFQAALEQDTTFAMAAYYVGRSLDAQEQNASPAFQRAARLAAHAPAREALFVRVWWPAAQNDPRWPALAESLAARYPEEPAARYAVGIARLMAANYAGAIAPLRDAVRMDSLSLTGPTAARCIACDAYAELVNAYVDMDSLPAADSVSRDWVQRQPRSPAAWAIRATVRNHLGRTAEAIFAQRIAGRLSGGRSLDLITQVFDAVSRNDLVGAEALLASGEDADWRARRSRVWWRAITLRYEGRPRAAAEVARALLAPEPTDSEHHLEWMPLGIAFFEAGDYSRAATAFDSAADAGAAFQRGHPWAIARRRAWTLTLRATVAAAQGDTAALRTLADTVARYGIQSALGRDRLLPAYIHGLSLERSGRFLAAVDSFRSAAFSPTEGFTRVNVELARSLVHLGRPREAIYWLEAALRGGMEGSNLYVTRTALREQLAQTFAAAGDVDSARTQYAMVVHAWANAEPSFRARRDSAIAYLARTAHSP